jgi:DNA-binding XRE family transcriptional regulator
MSKLSQTQYGTGKFNKSLYDLRAMRNWSQEQMGKECGGYNAHTIMRVENGISGGKLDFWQSIQKRFNISNEDMWLLMNGEVIEVSKYGTDVDI